MTATSDQLGVLPPHPPGRRATLRTPGGDALPVQTYDRGGEVVLLVLTRVAQPTTETLDPALLEYVSSRGVIRLRGEAHFDSDDVIRFHAGGEPEVIQRREFVRVLAGHDVELEMERAGSPLSAHPVDISGGGMLLAGAEKLAIGDTVDFEVRFDEDGEVRGTARVVRIDRDGRRGLRFDEISEVDRQRLIRFVFACLRVARARTRGDLL